ncbi:N-6 DNA methylase [Planococcaceae bacterium Storch 2/2-2]|nr:N-6 DNA methylase [Planococcaceae bacterium Storch 2/2-2]
MERIIKSKVRVQKHGEVFTPNRIVKEMLDVPGIRESCENLTATFLEPAAGEGAFLVEILDKKLEMVSEQYNDDLKQYENYSLLALSTLYGIELLEDNAQICVMNMYGKYYQCYQKQVEFHQGRIKKNVLDSAKKIISLNIENGNFLTRQANSGQPIVFSEWKPLNLRKTTKVLKVQRTEYTLDALYENIKNTSGKSLKSIPSEPEQLDIFSFLEEEHEVEVKERKEMIYVPVPIVDVYKEEMEEL